MGSVTVGNVRELLIVIGDEFAKNVNIFESINPGCSLLSRAPEPASRTVDGVAERSYRDSGWQATETWISRAKFWFLQYLQCR